MNNKIYIPLDILLQILWLCGDTFAISGKVVMQFLSDLGYGDGVRFDDSDEDDEKAREIITLLERMNESYRNIAEAGQ